MSTSPDIAPLPGLITDQTRPVRADGTDFVDLAELRPYGYEWISYQLVNGHEVTDVRIDGGREAGYPSVGCWGVVYDVADFHAFGLRLGAQALLQGCDHVLVDAEQCAKDTRAGRLMLPIVVGLREAGWHGPVHLSTLGAPVNAKPHGPNDFAIDVESFLSTGGSVQPQAYYNAYDEYAPWLCVDYWTAVGVPAGRLNLAIELVVEGGSAKETDYTGAEWAGFLERAGVGRNLNLYMVQYAYDDDLVGLERLTKPAAPAPPIPTPEDPDMEPVTDQQSREAVVFAVQAAAQNWGSDDKPRARLTVCRRIAQSRNDDAKWNACRDAIVAALDAAGVPR